MFVQGSCHLLSLTDFLAFVTELTVFCSSRGPNCARDNRQMVLATLGWAGVFCLSQLTQDDHIIMRACR